MLRAQPTIARCIISSTHLPVARPFTTSALLQEKALPPRRQIAEDEITESFLKGSGPGGQKINKTSSAVQLKHLPTGIVVKSQATRSRDQNRKYARQILGEKLQELEKGSDSRAAIKAERARAKKASASKKKKRKYKQLADEKGAGEEEEVEEHDGGVKDDETTFQPAVDGNERSHSQAPP
ncbi:RF-1 domain-containing protein [Neohortaea acidophila]|uniref:RF-1 domain-containing protein n=1 Tax=Neohortaea acidophila TaxID=245834 RepID=A0A6A6PFV5_9PEZI|nr:RF-1 domain-containing protein [Neohortaea acidophila]KAF2478842.1 RF-1 domain-containing protein [Neohortaea acidophila]